MRVATYNETPIEKWANDVMYLLKPFIMKYSNEYLIYDRHLMPEIKKAVDAEMVKESSIWAQYLSGVREGFTPHELNRLAELEKTYFAFDLICKENNLT